MSHADFVYSARVICTVHLPLNNLFRSNLLFYQDDSLILTMLPPNLKYADKKNSRITFIYPYVKGNCNVAAQNVTLKQ